ncbi:MAG: sigma-70 family RNA polymerase sigma factor [Fodinibius sp.]|nr:sigma-70 family RNA polymerase sigma factor [Fodinibius sp.]
MLANHNNNPNTPKGSGGDDTLLWEKFCDGDRQALNKLFRLYYAPIYKYGINIIANEDMVRDAIQDLFLKLWKKKECLGQPKSIKAYLLVSLRRILLRNKDQQHNRYQRNKTYLENADPFECSKESLMICDELTDEKKEALVNAYNCLSGRKRETFFLRYHHGLSNQEIADVIGISRQSVKNNLCRALKEIRSTIGSVPSLK